MASRTDDYHAHEYDESDVRYRRNARKPRRTDSGQAARRREQRRKEKRRVAVSQPFKCRRCKAFIGAPVSGGRQRNHCPNCLHSLHVDLKTPGDRASDCVSLMEPVASFFRPGGDQVVVHRCKGCGVERHNRIAADDSPLLLMRLPLVEPRAGTARQERQDRANTA